VRELIDEHIAARQPSGAEAWAAVPAVLLAALAHVLWPSPLRGRALLALDEAVAWASRAVTADMTLLSVLPLATREAA
jgi:hypothetical protein